MTASPEYPSYYPSAISMNPAWRDTLTHFIVVSTWPDWIDQQRVTDIYQSVPMKIGKLRELSPETGAYFNEADSYEVYWQDAFFGKNYERLREIKKKYDPSNTLWCRRCVGSEALVEQENGALCTTEKYSRIKELGIFVGYRYSDYPDHSEL